jgi:addiction module HigA family antidote
MEMKDPQHPGVLLYEEILEPLGLSVTEAARILGTGRQALSALVNGRAALSADMAIRFEKGFGVDAGVLLRMQAQHALAEVRRRSRSIKVRRYNAKAA